MTSGGVDRLRARLADIKEERAAAKREAPRTVKEAGARILELERRVDQLELFTRKPVVALATAILGALAVALAQIAS